ncbi:MAG: TOBE domain-containing protein, partial [Thermoanaerobacterales bacterium]|nr:TOBE domain-containing protein [Thermoanaerobacterales bacterium]
MKISGRNQISGKVTSLHKDDIMAKVNLDIGGQNITAVITRDAADDLGINTGDEVKALIKSTSVMLIK